MRISDTRHTAFTDLGQKRTHEWTTPPKTISITVNGSSETANIFEESPSEKYRDLDVWSVSSEEIRRLISRLRSASENFLAEKESYINKIDPEAIQKYLAIHYESPLSSWDNYLASDDEYERSWRDIESTSKLRDIALNGRELYEKLFPNYTKRREILDTLPVGSRINISWCCYPDIPNSHRNWLSHVPWGLMFCGPHPEENTPIDPLFFLGLRYRIEYISYRENGRVKKFLGIDQPNSTQCIYLMYWGNGVRSANLYQEASLQRDEWQGLHNSNFPEPRFAPEIDSQNCKAEVLELLKQPSPKPASLLYFFCRCSVDNDYTVLQFGDDPSSQDDVIRVIDMAIDKLANNPLVFANACNTLVTQPHILDDLEERFFKRSCRAYIGTETKIPTIFASRFASIYFHFLFGSYDSKPMTSGEAFVETRIFLWRHFRSIGGLFYSYIGDFDLFLAP